MKLAAYLRVSTDRQADDDRYGLPVQIAACRKWAREHGHKIIAWYRDEGVSGSNGLDTRVGLHEALAALRDHEAQGMIVYRLDRLARDLIIQETLLAEIRRMGAEAFSTSAAEASYLGDDPEDPSRKLIRQVLGAVNEYERSMIALRLRSGRAAKAAHGGYAYGSPAYGYRAEGKELVEDTGEQRAVGRIGELHQEGRSMRQIAAELDAEDIPAKRGGRWHPQAVARVVARLEGS